MAKKRTSMKKIREILRLNIQCNLSFRQIEKVVNVSRTVISQNITDFNKSGLKYKDIENIPDDDLEKTFYTSNKLYNSDKYKILSDNFAYYKAELLKKGVTLQLLWEEYKNKYPNGYESSQFNHHFKVWKDSNTVSMVQNYKAGEIIFVDYAGYKFKIYDYKTGEEKYLEIFVAVLGASLKTYVEVSESQKKHDFVKSNINMLSFFEGVPQAITTDCLKSAVSKADKYNPEINPEYGDFGNHYNTVIYPARPRKPKDKSLVENAVRLVYQRILAPLRNSKFYSIDELNDAIHQKLIDFNNRIMKGYGKSRQELYENIEAKALNELPQTDYEIKQFRVSKVQLNYHVHLLEDKHYYSVPFKLKGKRVVMSYTDKNVDIYYKNERVASFLRIKNGNRYTTNKNHMPSNHKYYSDWSPERINSWAVKHGKKVEELVQKIMNNAKYPPQAFKTCIGIIKLSNKYGSERLNQACLNAIKNGIINFQSVKNILSKGLDLQKKPNTYDFLNINHENIRGSNYYTEENQNDTQSHIG